MRECVCERERDRQTDRQGDREERERARERKESEIGQHQDVYECFFLSISEKVAAEKVILVCPLPLAPLDVLSPCTAL